MRIPEQGQDKTTILRELGDFKAQDLPWQSGKVLAYYYDPGREALETAKTAYMSYLTENALDPTACPSVMRLEREVVRMIANLLQGDEKVCGNLSSGGTESILLAVKTARDRARILRPEIKQPEMVIPQTAHSAFHKAAAYFDVKPVVTAFDPVTFRADVEAMRAAINENTILLVASAPGYAHGVVDPIPEVGQLALEHNLLFHVDACVGGIHLAIMRELGYDPPPYDFTVPGVTSISTDLHKYGYAPKNASVILYRDKDLRKHQIFACTRTTTYALVNPTIMSTKSGGPIAGAWATLHFLGMAGYKRIVREVTEATRKLVEGVNATGELRVLGAPDMCMFSFVADTVNLFQLADVMKPMGWFLQPQFSTDLGPANLHITVNYATVPRVEEFLADLRRGLDEVKRREPIDAAAIKAQIDALIQNDPENAAEQLLALAGTDGSTLPNEMALINTIMDALPPELSEALLVNYLNELYT